MKLLFDNLELFLHLAALAQLAVAVLNLFLVRIMKWERDLISAPQWSHYSASHWRNDRLRTLIHWTLFLGCGALGAIYFIAAGGVG